MSLNYKERDDLIFGKGSKTRYLGGVEKFGPQEKHSSITVETAKILIDKGFLDPEETQNVSPTAKEFVEFCEKYPQIHLQGYAVSPERIDACVIITGLVCYRNITPTMIREFTDKFRLADDFWADEQELYCWFD